MATYSAVDCQELHMKSGGAQTESITDTDINCSVVLQCAYADRHSLVQDILSNRREWPNSPAGWVVKPRAKSAAIKPFGAHTDAGQSITYEFAHVTVGYSSLAQADLVSEELEASAEFITQDFRNYRWANGNPLLEGEEPGKILHSISLRRTLYQIAALPGSILTLPGSCNLAAYNSALLGLTFGAETLMFEPAQMSRTITTSGTEGWTVALSFAFKPDGWNKYWREKTKRYEYMYRNDDLVNPHKPYTPADYSGYLF